MGAGQRRWAWHQLDHRWARQLVTDAAIARGALVIDVGAGLGAVTAPLLEAGARVIAVEAHTGRARVLRERFGSAIIVVRTDAADLRLPRRPYHVVANPPFDVTTAFLRRLLQPGSRLLTAHLVLQDQAVRRWTAGAAPGAPRWGQTFEASAGRLVPRSAFHPPPTVDARVLVMRRRPSRR